MIRSVSANKEGFHTVRFRPGANLVIAERSESASSKDTTNALGKSTLVDIIDFCLGSSPRPRKGLRVDALRGWEFTLELEVGGNEFAITRSPDNPGTVDVEGDTEGWPELPNADVFGVYRLEIANWRKVLAWLLFGLADFRNHESAAESSCRPSSRSLLSYFLRNQAVAYTDPFKHFATQKTWDVQVQNAFLLGLNWDNAAKWQRLKDRNNAIAAYKKAVKSGAIAGEFGTLGELEAERARLQARLKRESEALSNFRVLSQYREIEKQANELTSQIHELGNADVADNRRLELYRRTIPDMEVTSKERLEEVYEEAGMSLPGAVVRTLHEAREFRENLIANRRRFIADEIDAIEKAIEQRGGQVENLEAERAKYMKILDGRGALEEFSQLQELHTETRSKIAELKNRIEQQRRMNMDKVAINLETAELRRAADLDHEERRAIWSRALNLFADFSDRLYKAPGRLAIDIDDTGYRFDVEIAGATSDGIGKMKIFCYDLTLISAARQRGLGIDFLIHDSVIFDGVDARQRAHAIELADQMAKEFDFQYILTLNSDMLPADDFSPGFDHKGLVCLELTDTEDSGSLMGFRY